LKRADVKKLFELKVPKRVRVRVSSKLLKTRFVDCNVQHVKDVCKGSCCFNSKSILNVTIAPREEAYIKKHGVEVKDGFLQPRQGEKRCPFQRENGLCKIHKTKPIGCAISPFNLNRYNIVVVRYRYLCMNCHINGTKPAYKVFRKSLDIMFGKKEAARICELVQNTDAILDAYMFGDVWQDLNFNSERRRTK
jgi:Fe-S-cluster containining protein